MTVRAVAQEEAGATSEVAMRAKAHWGSDQDLLDAGRPEPTWAAEEIERDDVLVRDARSALVVGAPRTGEVPSGTPTGRVLPLPRFDLRGGAR